MPALDNCSIAIMAKAPLPGYCKTRLIPHIGAQNAARLQAMLISKTLTTALASGISNITLYCAPHTRHWQFLQARMQHPIRLQKQSGATLGDRMRNAVHAELQKRDKVIVLGTDCPALRPHDIVFACEQLAQADHVFQPAHDGGYVLAASRRYEPLIFRHIPWGSSKVMKITRRRLAQASCHYVEAPLLWDLDEINDLRRARKSGLI